MTEVFSRRLVTYSLIMDYISIAISDYYFYRHTGLDPASN